jgi:hypothetical protein
MLMNKYVSSMMIYYTKAIQADKERDQPGQLFLKHEKDAQPSSAVCRQTICRDESGRSMQKATWQG